MNVLADRDGDVLLEMVPFHVELLGLAAGRLVAGFYSDVRSHHLDIPWSVVRMIDQGFQED